MSYTIPYHTIPYHTIYEVLSCKMRYELEKHNTLVRMGGGNAELIC
jgi:hypothetical protein